MVEQFLKFGIAGIDYNRFHSSKNPIKTNNVDINKIVIFERCPCGKDISFSLDTKIITTMMTRLHPCA